MAQCPGFWLSCFCSFVPFWFVQPRGDCRLEMMLCVVVVVVVVVIVVVVVVVVIVVVVVLMVEKEAHIL